MATVALSRYVQWLDTSDNRQINVMRFSRDGECLATGDHNGMLLIYETLTWKPVLRYEASTAIRAIAWHPTSLKPRRLVAGADNGNVFDISFRLADGKAQDEPSSRPIRFKSLIHHIEFNVVGNQFAVAYGPHIYLINSLKHYRVEGGHLGIPKQSHHPAVTRGVHYISDEALIVIFMNPRMGIQLYSAQAPYELLRQFKLRPGGEWLIGSSALSPNRKMLVVTNFHDGVDWYSVKKLKYVHSTRFDPKEHFAVGIDFVTSSGVVVGRSRGGLILANLFTAKNPERQDLFPKSRTQIIAVGRRDGKIMVAAATKERETWPIKYPLRSPLIADDLNPTRTAVLQILQGARVALEKGEGQNEVDTADHNVRKERPHSHWKLVLWTVLISAGVLYISNDFTTSEVHVRTVLVTTTATATTTTFITTAAPTVIMTMTQNTCATRNINIFNFAVPTMAAMETRTFAEAIEGADMDIFNL
ncbi:hypothetical protein D9615_007592 [Tricholomella constricta]|uniref:Uncharacterized protein n=1 Tax=Tricholomella constricta TaxID=117010 RepID=A0A8H5H872_9AGAR|nr:hypothetical protein D9615_007592 [Tricholomella constricta]